MKNDFGKQIVLSAAQDLVDKIQDYSKSQVVLWRQVPKLALEADGRDGFSETYSLAYHRGIWRLQGSVSNGYYHYLVDLRTGTIVHFAKNYAPVEDVGLLIMLSNIKEFDAKTLVKELREDAKTPYHKFYADAQVQKTLAMKKEVAARLDAMMARPVSSLREPTFRWD